MWPAAGQSPGGISLHGETVTAVARPHSARVALLIDLERCTGCKSCEAACKQEHRLGPGEYRNKVVWASALEEAGLAFLTLTCQHCERPACLRACPVYPQAITKDALTGIVLKNLLGWTAGPSAENLKTSREHALRLGAKT